MPRVSIQELGHMMIYIDIHRLEQPLLERTSKPRGNRSEKNSAIAATSPNSIGEMPYRDVFQI